MSNSGDVKSFRPRGLPHCLNEKLNKQAAGLMISPSHLRRLSKKENFDYNFRFYTYHKKGPAGKNFGLFSPRYSENCILNGNLSHKMYTNRALFCKFRAHFLQNQGTFLLFPKKDMGNFPPPPASCEPPVLRFLAYFSILFCNSSSFSCTKSQLNLYVLTYVRKQLPR